MTPTRLLVGLAVVAAAGYAVISSTGSEGPKYLGDMPSLTAKASAAPPPVRHFGAGGIKPDPPHYAAHPVVPEAAAGPPPPVAGPGPIGAAGPAGGGGAGNGEPGAQPGIGGPAGSLPLGLLAGLPVVGTLPADIQALVDKGRYCVVGNRLFTSPCDQLPPGILPPGTLPTGTVPVGGTP